MIYDIEQPKLDSKNDHFGNRFASLGEVQRVVKKHLDKYGLSIHQTCQLQDDVVFFVTQLILPGTEDKEPQLVRQVAFPFSPGKDGPQAIGSAITYARRYGLVLLFQLIAEDDDDGERAEGRGGKKKPARKRTATKKADSNDEFGF